MLDKLEAIKLRFLSVQDDLTKPEVMEDMKLFTKLSREYKDLEELVQKFEEYKHIADNIESSKALLREEEDEEFREMAKAELAELEERLPIVEDEIKNLMVPKDPEDDNNVVLEIRKGAGGDEAALFAGDLFRMYEKYAEKKGWKMTLNSVQEGKVGGFDEIIATIEGPGAYGTLKYESGVHRVQRVPDTESQGRVHTSAASVAMMPEMEEVDFVVDDKDLKIDTYRASGAGGQHVNKTESAIRITHLPTNLVVTNQDQKSQLKNKEKALKILKSKLYDMELQKRIDEQASLRKTYVSTGDRSAKIRTYNYPQSRVTDHRIGLTLYKLDAIMNGDLDEICEALRIAENAEKMKAGMTL